MNLSNALKLFLGAIATIVLGAIGSGLWEKVLSPFLSYASGSITSALSYVSRSYSDSIYTSASNLYTPNSTEGLGIFIWFLVFCALFFVAINSLIESNLAQLVRRSLVVQFTGWFGVIQAVVMIFVLLFLMSKQATVEKIQSYSHKQMEILRPYVGEQTYAQLRSSYFKMRTKDDFEKFREDLIASGKSKGIVVETFAQ